MNYQVYITYFTRILSLILRNYIFHPNTFIINNGVIIDKKYRQFINNNNTKWFLKPFNGGGGKGIIVLSKIQDWKRHVRPRKNMFFTKELIVFYMVVESLIYELMCWLLLVVAILIYICQKIVV